VGCTIVGAAILLFDGWSVSAFCMAIGGLLWTLETRRQLRELRLSIENASDGVSSTSRPPVDDPRPTA
jgi:hypothetical protein